MSLPVPTQTRIYNRALALLGSSQRIANGAESSPVAESLDEHWDTAIRALLAEHPWNFAIKRAVLNPGGPPVFGSGSTYKLPPDCLRWLPWSRASEHYVRADQEEGFLVADSDVAINIRYIALIEDLSAWAPHVVDCLGYRLAMDAAEGVHSIGGNVADLERKYDAALVKAKRADGLATGDRERGDVTTQSRALDAAYRGHGAYYVPGIGWRR